MDNKQIDNAVDLLRDANGYIDLGLEDEARASVNLAISALEGRGEGEPVAWRYRVKGQEWELFDQCPFAETSSPGLNEELQALIPQPQR